MGKEKASSPVPKGDWSTVHSRHCRESSGPCRELRPEPKGCSPLERDHIPGLLKVGVILLYIVFLVFYS